MCFGEIAKAFVQSTSDQQSLQGFLLQIQGRRRDGWEDALHCAYYPVDIFPPQQSCRTNVFFSFSFFYQYFLTCFHFFSLAEAQHPMHQETNQPNCSDSFKNNLAPFPCSPTYFPSHQVLRLHMDEMPQCK